jgi:hypothetical protein
MQKKWHYIYVILYPALGYKFYYGSRVTTNHPEEDLTYFGSSVTFARYSDVNHEEYQPDALKVVLYSFYGKISKHNLRRISAYENRLIKEALTASHVGPEVCLNRNIAGRIYATTEERKEWSSRGGGKNADVLRQKLSKQYVFESPSGKRTPVFGLNTFAKKHNLNRGNLRAVHNGRRHSHKGWRKYEE